MSNYNHVFTISKYTLTFFLALGQDLCKLQESSSSTSCLKIIFADISDTYRRAGWQQCVETLGAFCRDQDESTRSVQE